MGFLDEVSRSGPQAGIQLNGLRLGDDYREKDSLTGLASSAGQNSKLKDMMSLLNFLW